MPIAIHGSSKVRNWKRLQFPKVTIQYGEAMRWEPVEDPTREQQQAVADEVLAEIRRLYGGLEEHGRRGIMRRLREQRRAGAGRPRAPRSPDGAPPIGDPVDGRHGGPRSAGSTSGR